jgi:hypothetical protein
VALTDSLVAYWPLDEASGDAIDAHGANDLTDNNGVGSATGKTGTARDFESDSFQWLQRADNTDLSVGDIDFSVALWIRPETNNAFAILSKVGGTNWAYDLRNTATAFYFTVASGSGPANQTSVTVGGAAVPGTWYFLAAYHDSVNNVIGISLNGATVVTEPYAHGSYDENSAFRLGFDGSSFMDGLMEDVGFWKRVLTQSEIVELYNGGAGRTYDYIVNSSNQAPTVHNLAASTPASYWTLSP